jgi:hypothetical protein
MEALMAKQRNKVNADALEQRLVGLLEAAADHVRKFDASRAHNPDNEEIGDQFSYGLASGLYIAVVTMVASEPGGFMDFSRWVDSGCPLDPFALAVRR